MNSITRSKPEMTIRTLIPFLGISFTLTWGLAAVLVFVGFSVPVYLLAVWAPGIAGILLVWRHFGFRGLGRFFRRMTLWRMSLGWWAYLLIGFPAMVYLGAAINGTISESWPLPRWQDLLPAILQALFLMGTNEEFGWRGLALPLLQRRFAPFWAGLILGVIWAIWHIPAFFISGLQYEAWAALPFFGGVIALSIILTPLFNSSRGSLLIAYLYHFQMMNPIFPDAQPWDSLFVGVVAVIIVIWKRETMFLKGSGVTEIVIPKEKA